MCTKAVTGLSEYRPTRVVILPGKLWQLSQDTGHFTETCCLGKNKNEKTYFCAWLQPDTGISNSGTVEGRRRSLLHSFFWAIPRFLNFVLMFRNAFFHIHLSQTFNYIYPNNHVPVILSAHTAYEDETVWSETSAYTIQTPGNHPKERIQHSEHGEM